MSPSGGEMKMTGVLREKEYRAGYYIEVIVGINLFNEMVRSLRRG